jgi:hypothetical protein
VFVRRPSPNVDTAVVSGAPEPLREATGDDDVVGVVGAVS